MSREIELSKGLVALVDDQDYGWLMTGGKWHARGCSHPYAVRTKWVGKRSHAETMHRLILPTDGQVDHINGDTLDNRRANLREATPSQNAQNRRRRADSRHTFKGVGRSVVPHLPWLAAITVAGKARHLGVFETEIEAARAYYLAAAELFGEFARLNFPARKEPSGYHKDDRTTF